MTTTHTRAQPHARRRGVRGPARHSKGLPCTGVPLHTSSITIPKPPSSHLDHTILLTAQNDSVSSAASPLEHAAVTADPPGSPDDAFRPSTPPISSPHSKPRRVSCDAPPRSTTPPNTADVVPACPPRRPRSLHNIYKEGTCASYGGVRKSGALPTAGAAWAKGVPASADEMAMLRVQECLQSELSDSTTKVTEVLSRGGVTSVYRGACGAACVEPTMCGIGALVDIGSACAC
jgi:hypothetical protein